MKIRNSQVDGRYSQRQIGKNSFRKLMMADCAEVNRFVVLVWCVLQEKVLV